MPFFRIFCPFNRTKSVSPCENPRNGIWTPTSPALRFLNERRNFFSSEFKGDSNSLNVKDGSAPSRSFVLMKGSNLSTRSLMNLSARSLMSLTTKSLQIVFATCRPYAIVFMPMFSSSICVFICILVCCSIYYQNIGLLILRYCSKY